MKHSNLLISENSTFMVKSKSCAYISLKFHRKKEIFLVHISTMYIHVQRFVNGKFFWETIGVRRLMLRKICCIKVSPTRAGDSVNACTNGLLWQNQLWSFKLSCVTKIKSKNRFWKNFWGYLHKIRLGLLFVN